LIEGAGEHDKSWMRRYVKEESLNVVKETVEILWKLVMKKGRFIWIIK